MTVTTIIIIALIATIIVMLFVFYAVAGKIDELKSEVISASIRTSKQFIELDGRMDAMSDIYGRLGEPLDNMHSDIFELTNMMEDTHLKMLHAYNEIEKIKFNAKHARKENTVPVQDEVTSVPETTAESAKAEEKMGDEFPDSLKPKHEKEAGKND